MQSETQQSRNFAEFNSIGGYKAEKDVKIILRAYRNVLKESDFQKEEL